MGGELQPPHYVLFPHVVLNKGGVLLDEEHLWKTKAKVKWAFTMIPLLQIQGNE